MPDEPNGKAKLDWRVGLLVIIAWIGTALIQWGTTTNQISDHTRRIELIEKQLAERSIARDEYERRHEDLRLQLIEIKEEVRELQKDVRDRK